MTAVWILILKVIIIACLALFVGYNLRLFSMGKIGSVIAFLLLLAVVGGGLYAEVFYPDMQLKLTFRSSFLNFALDLSLFVRIFFVTLFLGVVCSMFGVRFSMRIPSVRDLCVLAILIAITVLMGIYCTFRVGSAIKIAFKFIPIFVTAALFGPLWGGVIAALADVIAFVINPVGGAFLPQITMVEFLYGFTYGLFFYNMQSWNGFKTMLKIVACIVLQILVLNMGLTTYFLMPLMKMSFQNLAVVRAIPAVITMAIQLVVVTVLCKYIAAFRKILAA